MANRPGLFLLHFFVFLFFVCLLLHICVRDVNFFLDVCRGHSMELMVEGMGSRHGTLCLP